MEKLLYIGTRSEKSTMPGLQGFWMDSDTGRLRKAATGACCANPTYAAFSGDILYAVSETDKKGCAVSYRIDRDTGALAELDTVEFEGASSCHIEVWPGGKFISCSNYASGDFIVIPVSEGRFLKLSAQIRHFGRGFLSESRQEGPHVHSTWVTPGGKRLMVCDLGLDLVEIYDIDIRSGTLALANPGIQIYTPGGEGPRHLAFSDDGKYIYLLTELGNKCMVYEYDALSGGIRLIQTVSILPDPWNAFSKAAGVRFSPDGRYLYLSNRGADTIAVFAADKGTGLISLVQQASSRGVYPWCFCMDESFIVIANRDSNSVTVCRRDPESGLIGDAVHTEHITSPTFAGFA